jgi:hypothetical protein
MPVPHDYVLDPVPAVPIKVRGKATLAELFEVFAENHGVPLVGSGDPDLGPYSRCIRVAAQDVDAYRKKGYRTLSTAEEDAVFETSNDFGEATD